MRSELLWLVLLTAASCRQEMYDQPYLEPLEASDFFRRELSARPEVPGTVARGRLDLDAYANPLVDGAPAETYPLEIDREVLERGRFQYNVYCSPCHGLSGYGNGTIVRRGFPAPPSFHTEVMRAKPPGHYVHVIRNGFGVMFDYAARVRPRDRWAVAAYIQALQLSQSASIEDVPEAERGRLQAR